MYVYQNVELNKKTISKDLRNKGGIYLWWCKITGLFYVGSAKSFLGKNGRLNEYFQNNRLLNKNTAKISQDLAKDMLKYPKSFWNLIILEDFPTSTTKTGAMPDLNSQSIDKPKPLGPTVDTDHTLSRIRTSEQFWMLLLPTYNRSLVVGSNDGLPMPEAKRESMSTRIYIYEIFLPKGWENNS